jgi:hypothetical protein
MGLTRINFRVEVSVAGDAMPDAMDACMTQAQRLFEREVEHAHGLSCVVWPTVVTTWMDLPAEWPKRVRVSAMMMVPSDA